MDSDVLIAERLVWKTCILSNQWNMLFPESSCFLPPSLLAPHFIPRPPDLSSCFWLCPLPASALSPPQCIFKQPVLLMNCESAHCLPRALRCSLLHSGKKPKSSQWPAGRLTIWFPATFLISSPASLPLSTLASLLFLIIPDTPRSFSIVCFFYVDTLLIDTLVIPHCFPGIITYPSSVRPLMLPTHLLILRTPSSPDILYSFLWLFLSVTYNHVADYIWLYFICCLFALH